MLVRAILLLRFVNFVRAGLEKFKGNGRITDDTTVGELETVSENFLGLAKAPRSHRGSRGHLLCVHL